MMPATGRTCLTPEWGRRNGPMARGVEQEGMGPACKWDQPLIQPSHLLLLTSMAIRRPRPLEFVSCAPVLGLWERPQGRAELLASVTVIKGSCEESHRAGVSGGYDCALSESTISYVVCRRLTTTTS